MSNEATFVDRVLEEVSALRTEVGQTRRELSSFRGELSHVIAFFQGNGISKVAVLEHRVHDLEKQQEHARQKRLAHEEGLMGARMQSLTAKQIAIYGGIGSVVLIVIQIAVNVLARVFNF